MLPFVTLLAAAVTPGHAKRNVLMIAVRPPRPPQGVCHAAASARGPSIRAYGHGYVCRPS